jgi:hypothetical protein
VTASAAETLVKIKRDVVETIRRVVDVVSTYAGGALPEQAKRYIRQSILQLPVRWANSVQNLNANGHVTGGGGHGDVNNNNGAPGASSKAVPGQDGDPPMISATREAAQRVLMFAADSLEMLKSVNAIFAESAARAEECVVVSRVPLCWDGFANRPFFLGWIQLDREVADYRR